MATEGKKETIEERVEDAPSTSAVEEVVRDIETATDAKAEPAAEQAIATVASELQDVGVEPPENAIASLHEAAQAVGGAVIGSEVHAGSVDGSNVAFPPKESTVIKALFDSRKNLGPADNSSTWNNLEGIRGKLLKFVRGRQQKAA